LSSHQQVMIEVEHLTRRYGQVQAVNDISFSVNAGEIFGLLGHNGAGKTTTIRVLTGRTRPTSGWAVVAGCNVETERDKLKPRINLVFEDPNLYERFSGRENLKLFASLYGAPSGRPDELLKMVSLGDGADRKVKTYSTGMKQRLLIARSLINEPKVLFLDEPTRGLDPSSARDVRNILAQLSRDGTTIFLTTHYMEEADELCDRVAFLSAGEIVAIGTPRDLKLRHGQRTVQVLLTSNDEYTIHLDEPGDAHRLQDWMTSGQILTIHSQEGSLEDVFIAVAGRPLL
jgi:ABC-2 type transport system ATP-binding protein